MEERSGQILLRFLNSLKSKDPRQLQIFFLGDIFDLWVSDGKVFIQKYKALTEIIAELTGCGVKIYFFEGNHDLHIDPYWTKVLGVQVYVDPQYFDFDGMKVRLEHGDLINLEDKAYLRLRGVLRNPFIELIGHIMPGIVWLKLGDVWSPRSRKKTAKYGVRNEARIIDMIRAHAARAFAENSFDLIITGHMHVRDDYKFDVGSQSVRTINLGSWFQDVQILKIANKQVEWLALN